MNLDNLSNNTKNIMIVAMLEEVERLRDELATLKQEVKVNNVSSDTIVRILKPIR